jgi:hypothetical protein
MQTKSRQLILTVSTLSLLTLSGCINLGGGTTTPTKTATDQTTQVYETNEFSISIPKGWEIIEKKDFTSDVPATTQVVFRNNVKNETFTANVNIVKNTLQQTTSTTDYANMVLNREKTGLYNYTQSGKEQTKISIGGTETDTLLTLFEAKESTSANTVRYLQTYGVKSENAYIVTGSISPKENETVLTTIESIVKSFKIK